MEQGCDSARVGPEGGGARAEDNHRGDVGTENWGRESEKAGGGEGGGVSPASFPQMRLCVSGCFPCCSVVEGKVVIPAPWNQHPHCLFYSIYVVP